MAVQEGEKPEREEHKQVLLKLALCGRVDGNTGVFLAHACDLQLYILYLFVLLRLF